MSELGSKNSFGKYSDHDGDKLKQQLKEAEDLLVIAKRHSRFVEKECPFAEYFKNKTLQKG